jgi:hypothetical protein
MLDAPGSYSITELPDGIYYMVSLMQTAEGEMQTTDPWGYYGSMGTVTPVTITGGIGVSGIDITLNDGTEENPNPFARNYASPVQVLQLPETIETGTNSSIYSDGSSIYIYKHDYENAEGARIFKINPSSGEVIDTYILELHSSPNMISWLDEFTFHNGELWATGGYGDPLGSGWIPGIFRIDISGSSSSNQIPADTAISLNGLTSDGVNLYAAVELEDSYGVIRFVPGQVSEVPSSLFIELDYSPTNICYADNYLWVGTDNVKKIDPVTGTVLGEYNIPPEAAELYLNEMFWYYDEYENMLEAYSLESVGVEEKNNSFLPLTWSLSQNYPNPFNPTTTIKYQIPKASFVSLKIYDINGREVEELINEQQNTGHYEVQFNAGNLSSGVYFYRLQAGSFMETKKLILLK